MTDLVRRAVVIGVGATGQAAARHLRSRGVEVVVVDDHPQDAALAAMEALGFEVLVGASHSAFDAILDDVDLVVPSPGVAVAHAMLVAAAERGVVVRSEVDLAAAWAAESGLPLVAVTGTNGKTTVTTLIVEMLEASGRRALAAGNIGLPLTDAVAGSRSRFPGEQPTVLVAEVSSFQLAFVDELHPSVAVWLNFAPDHLDWHLDVASYAAAKSRIWARQTARDVAVVNADDPVVISAAAAAPSRVVTFGLAHDAVARVRDGRLLVGDQPLLTVDELGRALPHDMSNALAASAAALAAGATADGVCDALRCFIPLAHRISLVAESNGVRWYDDSKATNPQAAVAAITAYPSVVLLAGGRNKGLDLGPMADIGSAGVHHVVAFGEAANEVESAFSPRCPVVHACSMREAVVMAANAALPGDVVLLSPGCASFDWYDSYSARGDDFAAEVRRLVGERHG